MAQYGAGNRYGAGSRYGPGINSSQPAVTLSQFFVNDSDKIVLNPYVLSNSPSSLTINWSLPSNVSGISGYRIYRAFDYTQIFTPIGISTSLSYVDSGLQEGNNYFYRIRTIYS